MRIFLTGATGFIGSALIPELRNAGHSVLGLSRSESGASVLEDAGAEVHRGDLEDLESLRSGAAACDAVMHLGFIHDFARFNEVCEIDRRAIRTMGAVLAKSQRPLVITSGTGMGMRAPGILATEDYFDSEHSNPRTASEMEGASVAAGGTDVRVVRLPQVHDPVKQGLITWLVALAREKGVSAYIGSGDERWPAVHRAAAAELYRMVLERGAAGLRYNAVAEPGVPVRKIADAIAQGLKIPSRSIPLGEAAGHFGWLAMFAGLDMPASSELTQQRLGWRPTGPDLLSDLNAMKY